MGRARLFEMHTELANQFIAKENREMKFMVEWRVQDDKRHEALKALRGNAWLIQWNNIVDIQTTPVVDDNEAREFGRKALA